MIRIAEFDDLEGIVGLLVDDEIGRRRELVGELGAYGEAFAEIQGDDRNLLAVAVHDGDRIVGCIQATFIRGLSHRGALRCLIEDVRVARDQRRRGLGASLFEWVIEEARKRDCRFLELFMHKDREEARRLYAALGFQNEHEGYRMVI
ncbi:GNAT family N-acetyltransferase [Rhizorhapis suberifaciens]|uniref:GNAT superfamily N-acetyltransferase n=1 Tax=Rhizorhapis suberifaciens TaxID=13656 RepID=A0A840HZI4_9SPHN|nr:GNAT family N-acetyltransferase [Rhizorhapis suberifaciens]MBB4642854.1 GNAT superfamily N-acetyltransferase [Rhizorhapis suberifaciens]